MSTKNQNYFNKSQARNTNFVHRIQHSTHMIKIYGMPTCPDCTYLTAPSPSSRKKPGSTPGPSPKAPPAGLMDPDAEGGLSHKDGYSELISRFAVH